MRYTIYFTPRNATTEQHLLLAENDYTWLSILPSEGTLRVIDTMRNMEVYATIRFEENAKDRELNIKRAVYEALEGLYGYSNLPYLTQMSDVTTLMGRSPYVHHTVVMAGGQSAYVTTKSYDLQGYTLSLFMEMLARHTADKRQNIKKHPSTCTESN